MSFQPVHITCKIVGRQSSTLFREFPPLVAGRWNDPAMIDWCFHSKWQVWSLMLLFVSVWFNLGKICHWRSDGRPLTIHQYKKDAAMSGIAWLMLDVMTRPSEFWSLSDLFGYAVPFQPSSTGWWGQCRERTPGRKRRTWGSTRRCLEPTVRDLRRKSTHLCRPRPLKVIWRFDH